MLTPRWEIGGTHFTSLPSMIAVRSCCVRNGRVAEWRPVLQIAAVLDWLEACVGAHHLSRKLKAFGHDARLMPAKYVRPYWVPILPGERGPCLLRA